MQPSSTNWREWDTQHKQALLIRLREKNSNFNEEFANFQARYRELGPVAFVNDCVTFPPGKTLIPYQAEILEDWYRHHKIAVRGPHGLGKTALAAWAILFAVLVFNDTKIVTTATAYRQLKEYLWPEVHKWAYSLRWDIIGRKALKPNYELKTMAITRGMARAFAAASNDHNNIEGAHAPVMFYIFDEAKAIPNKTWDAAEGAFSQAGKDTGHVAFAMAISTPGEAIGRFYDIHSEKEGFEDWTTRWVTKEEAIAAGQMSAEWADRMRRRLGEKHPIYLNRVEGAFATSAPDQLIPLWWVDLANQRWEALHDKKGNWIYDLSPIQQLGCDPATDHGPDLTVVAEKRTVTLPLPHDAEEDTIPDEIEVISDLHPLPGRDTMEAVGFIMRLRGKVEARVSVDVIGIGDGVVTRLRELIGKRYVIAFNAAEKTNLKDRSGEQSFSNKRAAGWWMLREALDPAFDPTLALPPIPELIEDLTKPKFRYLSSGKIEVESKAKIRDRLGSVRGRSTDWADAVIHALWKQPKAFGMVTSKRNRSKR
jgi:hypothetical protein